MRFAWIVLVFNLIGCLGNIAVVIWGEPIVINYVLIGFCGLVAILEIYVLAAHLDKK